MCDADLAKQAERVTELLYQLKEEGVEFPGRMRDHVAEACKVSAAKLATLKVIREKLLPPFSEQFNTGELSTQAAYALARLSDNAQKLLAENVGKKIISGYAAENTLKNETALLSNHERHRCPNGTTCQNTAGFLIGAAAVQYSWNACEGRECCLDCYHTESCPGRCQTCRDKQKKTKQQEAAKEAKRQQERKQQSVIYRAKTVESAKRLLKAVDAAGVADDMVLFKKFGYQKFDVKRLRKDASDDFKEDASFYGNGYDDLRQDQLIELSGLLHCSADYLLGLTDELQPAAAAAPAAPEWQTGEPPERGWYVIKMETGAGKSFPKAAFYDNFGKTWRFGASGGTIDDEYVLGWYKIPEV